MRQRDTTSVHTIAESSRKLRRVCNSIATKMKRFHEGEWIVAVSSLIQDDRTHGIRKVWKVFGSDPTHIHSIEETLAVSDTRKTKASDFMVMPGNAEKRAQKVRKLIAMEWEQHTRGTPFEGKKQVYSIVSRHPDMIFPWWRVVTHDAPFCNTSVNDPDLSERVYTFLARKIFSHV